MPGCCWAPVASGAREGREPPYAAAPKLAGSLTLCTLHRAVQGRPRSSSSGRWPWWRRWGLTGSTQVRCGCCGWRCGCCAQPQQVHQEIEVAAVESQWGRGVHVLRLLGLVRGSGCWSFVYAAHAIAQQGFLRPGIWHLLPLQCPTPTLGARPTPTPTPDQHHRCHCINAPPHAPSTPTASAAQHPHAATTTIITTTAWKPKPALEPFASRLLSPQPPTLRGPAPRRRSGRTRWRT